MRDSCAAELVASIVINRDASHEAADTFFAFSQRGFHVDEWVNVLQAAFPDRLTFPEAIQILRIAHVCIFDDVVEFFFHTFILRHITGYVKRLFSFLLSLAGRANNALEPTPIIAGISATRFTPQAGRGSACGVRPLR